QRQSPLHAGDGSPQSELLVAPVAPTSLPLIVRGPGNRTRPARGCLFGQRPLSLSATIPASSAMGAAQGQVLIGQAAQIQTQRPEHQGVPVVDPKPGTDSNAPGWLDQKSEGQWTKAMAHWQDFSIRRTNVRA